MFFASDWLDSTFASCAQTTEPSSVCSTRPSTGGGEESAARRTASGQNVEVCGDEAEAAEDTGTSLTVMQEAVLQDPSGRQAFEEVSDAEVPTNMRELREKMRQQRQRAVARHLGAAGPGGRALQRAPGYARMVQATDAPSQQLQVGGSSGSSAMQATAHSSSSSSSGSSAPRRPSSPQRPHAASWATAARDNPRALGTMAVAGPYDPGPMTLSAPAFSAAIAYRQQETLDVIVPLHYDTAEEVQEADARRRDSLAQDLEARGVATVFDPVGPPPKHVECSLRADAKFDVHSLASMSPEDLRTFIMEPSPKSAGMIECRITRLRKGFMKRFPKYTLETDSGIFLLSAEKRKKNRTSNYAIAMSDNIDEGVKDRPEYVGKLRASFLGLEFVAYSRGFNPLKIDKSMPKQHALRCSRQELVSVQYSCSIWGGTRPRGPRQMKATIPKVLPSGERQECRTLDAEKEGLIALEKDSSEAVQTFSNKPPRWNEQLGAYVLNFNRRVTQASVKNFQLTTIDDPDTVFLQFGRVGKDEFNMDFRYPFSAYQAFAICLSAFDYKLCCE
eukprot:TRINITY_DN2230_c0_g2_i1.p1 TRINITY_DN2230_c0_g2~~TRINITY_DN2230_c0_g2_i1.p1  ORF type:complete len:560 (+),score=149.49 TRINITY_DN2230_c0_g2_i1:107-1786(+)